MAFITTEKRMHISVLLMALPTNASFGSAYAFSFRNTQHSRQESVSCEDKATGIKFSRECKTLKLTTLSGSSSSNVI
ncbi:hypothetical protein N7463_001252 [Penicillium fimorum]|uniref:Uncharacterized protein n=1 Tax=Penicillium fimorum TaxID=1882269 RepID=A0A9X0CBW1_9EURO|nr:hypothetical protein N7463_001252 [Penicillium fimorum]